LTDPSPSSSRPALTRLDWAVAIFSILAIVVHDGAHVAAGRYWDVFWICNVAALFVGPAVLLRSPAFAAVALTWLVPGTIVWLSDVVLAGSNILPTSYAVHLGGSVAVVYATRRVGFSERGWLFALGVLIAAALTSRFLLPPHANVNAAHSVPRGWGFLGGTPGRFAFASFAIAVGTCLIGRLLGRTIAGTNARN
jgi:hypothetical protein